MKPVNTFISIAVAIINIAVIVCVYWLVYPYNPVEFKNLPHKVDKTIVESGGYLTYDVDYCKYTNITPIVTKHFIDGIIYTVPQVIATKKGIGCDHSAITVYVPKALPQGDYYLEIEYRYQMNPLRYVDVITKTEKFTVQ